MYICEINLRIIQIGLIFILMKVKDCMSVEDFKIVISAEIPSHAEFGGTTQLRCHHNLSEINILSLKWYKDEEEFCRISPNGNPQIFPTNGVYVKDNNCKKTEVNLFNLTLNSSGFYKCELSSEGPPFKVFSAGKTMSVFVMPKDDPILSGIEPAYRTGQFVSIICTASPSIPAADIFWFVDGKQANYWEVLDFPVLSSSKGYSSSKLLRLQVHATTVLLCQAKLPSLPPWQAAVVIHLDSETSNSHQRSGHCVVLFLLIPILHCDIERMRSSY